MFERRSSLRVQLDSVWVKEENGDFLHSFKACDLSEEGIFLQKRIVSLHHEAFSLFSFCLPDGQVLRNLTGRVVRQEKREGFLGSAVQFLNLKETHRMALKKFIVSKKTAAA